MITIRQILYAALLVFAVQAECKSEVLQSENIKIADSTRQSIIFISDTQAPMAAEKFFVKTHNNEKATEILFDAILSDSAVSSVFMLGDLTAMGSFDNNWTAVDTFLADLKLKNISVHAAIGNHDYLLFSNSGETNLKKRFPDFNRTGYSVRIDSLAIILLNSNFAHLNRSDEEYQEKWYNDKLQSLEKDSTVKMTIVACHHSPFSNSTIVGSDKKVRRTFVPSFLKSRKCRIFISGHAHTFQHFNDTLAGKHFLVIGGGGGLLHKLEEGEADELQDQVKWDTKYRMFHFVKCDFKSEGLLLRVMMLDENLTGPKSVYELFIPFPPLKEN
ncbi:MAG: metallophosphoesterase [Bacteroidetes bacterium]|nr:metallophosphoesterase [Bacteroidota bacterium]